LIHEVSDKRKEYADKLREFAEVVESGQNPKGIFLLFFTEDPLSRIVHLEKHEPGFNEFEFIGALQSKIVRLVFEREVERTE
jgi:hypothetical protein